MLSLLSVPSLSVNSLPTVQVGLPRGIHVKQRKLFGVYLFINDIIGE